jgi:hypothetical protein
VGCYEKTVHVKNREHMKKDIVCPKAPLPVKDFGVHGKISVREHHALGAARGTGSIEDCGQIVAIA